MNRYDPIQTTENVIDWDKDPFIKYQDLFKDTIDWAKDPMSHPTNQNKYFYSDGKTYYEQICKMLKLMSAFKESFAYIYENEEELHSAWENFVDNLSASAEYGEEVGVTLTWTEDSVNFDFTIPGGADGVGIQSIVFNQDYSMTITLTDGTVYNSPSLRGPQGETGATGAQGPQGPQGEGLEILDVYATLADLQTAHPTGSAGDAYQVGTSPNFTLYIWSTSQQAWVPAGALTSPDATTTTPLMDGTASVGSENAYARGDHRHPTDTSRASASDLTTVSENLLELTGDVSDIADGLEAVQTEIEDLSDIVQVSQSLIDQEFLYRETPADHDTIARLDSIKGNTISFNQLAKNGNFVNTDDWTPIRGTGSVSNNVYTYTISEVGSGAVTNRIQQDSSVIAGHKYYIKCHAKASKSGKFNVGITAYELYVETSVSANTKTLVNGIISLPNEAHSTPKIVIGFIGSGYYAIDDSVEFSNYQIFDLTLMGIDSFTTPVQVEAWLLAKLGPLDYFGYDPGSLISFKGTGLKTTGKNLLQSQNVGSLTGVTINELNGTYTLNGTSSGYQQAISSTSFILQKGTYTLYINRSTSSTAEVQIRSTDGATIYGDSITGPSTFTLTEKTEVKFRIVLNAGTFNNVQISPQLEIGSEATSFEPYTSNTQSLPIIAEKFPDGEMSAGTAYDELAETDYDKRIGMVDLGNLEWYYVSNVTNPFFNANLPQISSAPTEINMICNKYAVYKGLDITGSSTASGYLPQRMIGEYANQSRIAVKDSSFTDVTTFKNAMKGQYLYFELATPLHNYGVVDLGTLNWQRNATYNVMYCYVTGRHSGRTNILCSKYVTVDKQFDAMQSGEISGGLLDNGLNIKDDNFTDATAFKTAMSGVYLLYEKDTPEIIDLDLTYPIEKGGTEQLLPVNTSTPVTTPLLADMTYMSTDEAIQYLYANGSANVESEISALDSRLDTAEDDIDAIEGDIATINTTIGSESTTPMSGILGRLNEAESDISFMEKKIVWQNPKESGWMSSFAETHIDLTDAGVENYRFLEVISILNSGGPFAVTTGPIALDFSYADHTGYGTLFNMGTTGATNNYLYHDRDISYFDSTKQLNIYDCYAHENGVAPYVTNNYLIPVLAIVYN